MPRPVKCRQCEKFEHDRSKLIKIDLKGFFHLENCHNEYLNIEENKILDNEEKRSLLEKVASIYDIDIRFIPTMFIIMIDKIRRGNDSLKGIRYNEIENAFDFCKKMIDKARETKKFSSTIDELRYGLGIVKNNFNDASKQNKKEIN